MKGIDDLVALFARHGGGAYFGEAVSQVEHALQAAHFAELDGAPEPLVLAALLHDVGHLVGNAPDDLALWHSDARHELSGAAWLSQAFGPAVSEPVRLHVAAKRYLCAVDPRYHDQLSEASIVTLKLQGGPMPADEVAQFEREPYYREAVQVRLCDDRGKVVGLATRRLDDYRGMMQRHARVG